MIGTRRQDAPRTIEALTETLGLSSKQVAGLRRKHGDGLIRVLQDRWYTTRDQPRLLHRSSEQGYTAEPGMAMDAEPEAVPEDVQARLSTQGRTRFAELKAQEVDAIARSNTRSRVARLRQVETMAQRKGVDALPYLVAIESQIRALEAELDKAA